MKLQLVLMVMCALGVCHASVAVAMASFTARRPLPMEPQ